MGNGKQVKVGRDGVEDGVVGGDWGKRVTGWGEWGGDGGWVGCERMGVRRRCWCGVGMGKSSEMTSIQLVMIFKNNNVCRRIHKRWRSILSLSKHRNTRSAGRHCQSL